MTITTGPLFSLDARGSIAKTLTYSKQRGTTYTKQYAVPTGIPTDAQIITRDAIRLITQAWQSVTAEERATWQTLATAHNTSLYHAYLRSGCQRWRDFLLPTAAAPQPGTLTIEENNSITYYDDPNDHLDISIYGPTDAPFTIAITRSTDDPYTPDKTNLILLSSDWFPDDPTFTLATDISNPLGTPYYYKFTIGSRLGHTSPCYNIEAGT